MSCTTTGHGISSSVVEEDEEEVFLDDELDSSPSSVEPPPVEDPELKAAISAINQLFTTEPLTSCSRRVVFLGSQRFDDQW